MLKLSTHWSPVSGLSQGQWRSRVAKALSTWRRNDWDTWVKAEGPRNSDLQLLMPEPGPANYIGHYERLPTSLVAAIRLGSAKLNCNKTTPLHDSPLCRFGCGHLETETHILLDQRCRALSVLRRPLMATADKAKGGPQWRSSRSPKALQSQKTLLLTGKGCPRSARKPLGQALVKFLVAVETLSVRSQFGSLLDKPWTKPALNPREDWLDGCEALRDIQSWTDLS
jgi:hypothetical protein